MYKILKCPLCGLDFNSECQAPVVLECGRTICIKCLPSNSKCPLCNSVHDWSPTEFFPYKSALSQLSILCHHKHSSATVIDPVTFTAYCDSCKSPSKIYIPIDETYFLSFLDYTTNSFSDNLRGTLDNHELLNFFQASSSNELKLENLRRTKQLISGRPLCKVHPDVPALGIDPSDFQFYCGCRLSVLHLFETTQIRLTIKKKLRYLTPLSKFLIDCINNESFEVHRAIIEIQMKTDASIYHRCPLCLEKFRKVEPVRVKCHIQEGDTSEHIICVECANKKDSCKIDGGIIDGESAVRELVGYPDKCDNCRVAFLTADTNDKKRFPYKVHCGHNVCGDCVESNEEKGPVLCMKCSLYCEFEEVKINTGLAEYLKRCNVRN